MEVQETVHVFARCVGPSCDYIHDYIRINEGFYVCVLPDSYSGTAIRLRIRRRREKGQNIGVKKQQQLKCPKCGHFIWILEMPSRSTRAFAKTFKDSVVYAPKDMMTESEIESKGTDVSPISFLPLERFLDIDNPQTDTYRVLIDEINTCFQVQAYSATMVLIRKIIENLIVDLLRKKYGNQEIELFYITAQSRFRNLSELVSNLRSRVSDFGPLGLEKRDLTTIEKLREEGNSQAHSVIDHATRDELMKLQPTARKTVKALLTVRELLFKGIKD